MAVLAVLGTTVLAAATRADFQLVKWLTGCRLLAYRSSLSILMITWVCWTQRRPLDERTTAVGLLSLLSKSAVVGYFGGLISHSVVLGLMQADGLSKLWGLATTGTALLASLPLASFSWLEFAVAVGIAHAIERGGRGPYHGPHRRAGADAG
jgi:hypothetical protein